MDLQHNVFERDKSLLGGVSLPLDQPGAVAGEVYSLLKQYTGMILTCTIYVRMYVHTHMHGTSS